MKYKFDIQDMLPIGVTIIVTGMVLAFGLQIAGETRDDIAEDSCPRMHEDYAWNSTSGDCYNASNTTQTEVSVSTAEYNATSDTIEGVGKFSEKLPLIATVVVAVIIIGILVTYFAKR